MARYFVVFRGCCGQCADEWYKCSQRDCEVAGEKTERGGAQLANCLCRLWRLEMQCAKSRYKRSVSAYQAKELNGNGVAPALRIQTT